MADEQRSIDQEISSRDPEEASIRLASYVAIVTGGGTGIGAAIARLFDPSRRTGDDHGPSSRRLNTCR
jgi:hypothetical protein